MNCFHTGFGSVALAGHRTKSSRLLQLWTWLKKKYYDAFSDTQQEAKEVYIVLTGESILIFVLGLLHVPVALILSAVAGTWAAAVYVFYRTYPQNDSKESSQ